MKAVKFGFITTICLFAFSLTPVLSQTGNKKNREKVKSPEEIPEQFKLTKGLPPSKRRQLRIWIQKLQFERPLTRMRAARELYWYRDREAIPYLVTALRDPFWGVRKAAARSIAILGEIKYSFVKFRLPDQLKIKQLEDRLTREKQSMEKKGGELLKAEKIDIYKTDIDVIGELKAAYYREVVYNHVEMVKQEIRSALEDLGATEKVKRITEETYNLNRNLNRAK